MSLAAVWPSETSLAFGLAPSVDRSNVDTIEQQSLLQGPYRFPSELSSHLRPVFNPAQPAIAYPVAVETSHDDVKRLNVQPSLTEERQQAVAAGDLSLVTHWPSYSLGLKQAPTGPFSHIQPFERKTPEDGLHIKPALSSNGRLSAEIPYGYAGALPLPSILAGYLRQSPEGFSLDFPDAPLVRDGMTSEALTLPHPTLTCQTMTTRNAGTEASLSVLGPFSQEPVQRVLGKWSISQRLQKVMQQGVWFEYLWEIVYTITYDTGRKPREFKYLIRDNDLVRVVSSEASSLKKIGESFFETQVQIRLKAYLESRAADLPSADLVTRLLEGAKELASTPIDLHS